MPGNLTGVKKTAKARPHHAPGGAASPRVSQDAVSLLRADHTALRRLLSALKSAPTPTQRQRLLANTRQELQAHTAIEEEIFYPAFRAAGRTKRDEQLFHEATAEHHAAELVLHEVGSADDAGEQFPGRAKVLKELVEHHAREEETDMFPRARELIGAAELRSLGQQMADRKRALRRDHAGTESALAKVVKLVGLPFSGRAKATPQVGT